MLRRSIFAPARDSVALCVHMTENYGGNLIKLSRETWLLAVAVAIFSLPQVILSRALQS